MWLVTAELFSTRGCLVLSWKKMGLDGFEPGRGQNRWRARRVLNQNRFRSNFLKAAGGGSGGLHARTGSNLFEQTAHRGAGRAYTENGSNLKANRPILALSKVKDIAHL